MVRISNASKPVGVVRRAALAAALAFCPITANAQTLNEALAAAYRYNPQLDAQRARLRATDEDVARAMSGYRPTITGSADVGVQHTKSRPPSILDGKTHPKGYSVDLVQPIFRGFQTVNAVSEQEANVRAGREQLRNVEQTVLLEAVTAYMDVLRDQAVVRLNENNVKFLSRELKATQDRFAVGEVTRTDVAQAKARRAGAVSNLDQARANLTASRATYVRVVGTQPGRLREPRSYRQYLPSSLQEAIEIGTHENPLVIQALFLEQAARFTVDRIRGELLPQVQLEASYSKRFDSSTIVDEQEVGTVTGRLNVPIYQAGDVSARVRQAKHIHVSRLQEIEQARSEAEARVVGAWSQLQAARGRMTSDRAQVKANKTALTGVREEERVGQRTLLDVLNAQVELLDSRVTLATTRRDLVVAAYSVFSSVGRLDALSLGFDKVAYDPEANYNEVRRKFWGTSITHSDGRVEHLEPVK